MLLKFRCKKAAGDEIVKLTLLLLVRWVKPVIQDFIMVMGRQRALNAPINSLLTSEPTLQHTSAHT